MQKIKGESSYWINKNKMTKFKFEWQDDYYAVSIGMSQLDTLKRIYPESGWTSYKSIFGGGIG